MTNKREEKCCDSPYMDFPHSVPSTPDSEEWAKAFDEKFPQVQDKPTHYLDDRDFPDCKCISCNAKKYHPKIKSFIRNLLSHEREMLKSKIEGMDVTPIFGTTWADTNYDNTACAHGYNQALSDILALMEKR